VVDGDGMPCIRSYVSFDLPASILASLGGTVVHIKEVVDTPFMNVIFA